MTNEEMALKIQAGEQGLISALWEQNTGLFAIKANSLYQAHYDRCQASGVTFDDVFQVCYFALLDAVQVYDPARGYKFTSYLTYPLKNHFNALVGLRSTKRDPLNDAA